MKANLRVLVVDDDPVVGRSFDRVLSAKGYVVVTASDGSEALAKLRNEEYDLVYTDIKMPGMDGLEVAERVKERKPWTPVVIVTGYGTPASEERARAAGVAAFLHKPLSPEMIEGSVAKALAEAASIPEAVAAAAAGIAEKVEVEVEAPARASASGALMDAALLFAAPFIGLAFVLALPFAGVAMLAWFFGRSLMKVPSARKALIGLKNVALFIASPFIGLAYVLIGPFVGIAALAWYGGRALFKRRGSE